MGAHTPVYGMYKKSDEYEFEKSVEHVVQFP
jgi:hypothetical protein